MCISCRSHVTKSFNYGLIWDWFASCQDLSMGVTLERLWPCRQVLVSVLCCVNRIYAQLWVDLRPTFEQVSKQGKGIHLLFFLHTWSKQRRDHTFLYYVFRKKACGAIMHRNTRLIPIYMYVCDDAHIDVNKSMPCSSTTIKLSSPLSSPRLKCHTLTLVSSTFAVALQFIDFPSSNKKESIGSIDGCRLLCKGLPQDQLRPLERFTTRSNFIPLKERDTWSASNP